MNIKKLLIVAAAIAASATAFAWPGEEPPPPPPPPPPELNLCSPGFWKNHQEYWATLYCGSQACVDAVMTELESKGPGSGDRRATATSALNGWADDYYRAVICPNDS